MKKPTIVVTEPLGFFPDQIKRLKSLGDVTFYDDLPKSPEEWVERCSGAEIVCSGKLGLKEKLYEIKNTFFSLPFVAVGWIDKEKLKKSGNTVSYSPGCNRHAVSEWIVAMMLIMLRKFNKLLNTERLKEKRALLSYKGLSGKKVIILGKGYIGTRVGRVCKALEMEVDYFERGDNLHEVVKDADVIVNVLSKNDTTTGILGKTFFSSLKKGKYFITVTSQKIYDSDAMLEAFGKGVLVGIADDAGGIIPGAIDDPYYEKLVKHPNVLTTPHMAFQSDTTVKIAGDMMIDNVEAWIKGKPINVVN
jgi:phosphoglycerate dehydrogenase-like enzyme